MVFFVFISLITITLGTTFNYFRMPNAYDDALDLDFCVDEANGYAYDGNYVYCDTDLSGVINPTYFWNNTDVTSEHSETISSANFGVYLNCTNGGGSNIYEIKYGFASTPDDCTSVGTWIDLINDTSDPCPYSFQWVNATNSTSVTWTNINNTCWSVGGDKVGGGDDADLLIDGFHVDVTYIDNPPQYSGEATDPVDPVTYSSGANYQFNITWSDDNGLSEIVFEFDGTNYSFLDGDVTNTSNEYNVTLNDISAGSYSYTWYANDSVNQWNNTGFLTYTINKAPTNIQLFLNGSESDVSYIAGQSANFTGTINVSGISLGSNYTGWVTQSVDAVTITNLTTLTAIGNLWNMSAYPNDAENYSGIATHFFNVTNIAPQWFNQEQSNDSIDVGGQNDFSTKWTDLSLNLFMGWLSTNETGAWYNYTDVITTIYDYLGIQQGTGIHYAFNTTVITVYADPPVILLGSEFSNTNYQNIWLENELGGGGVPSTLYANHSYTNPNGIITAKAVAQVFDVNISPIEDMIRVYVRWNGRGWGQNKYFAELYIYDWGDLPLVPPRWVLMDNLGPTDFPTKDWNLNFTLQNQEDFNTYINENTDNILLRVNSPISANLETVWIATDYIEVEVDRSQYYNSPLLINPYQMNWTNTTWLNASATKGPICWKYYANDSYGLENVTDEKCFEIISPPECQTPSNNSNYLVNESTTLCTAYYNDTHFFMNNDSIFLDGNQSILDGVYGGTGIYSSGKTNNTIRNFDNIYNYQYGMHLLSSTYYTIDNIIIGNNLHSSFRLQGASHNIFSNITTSSNIYHGYLIQQSATNNTIRNNTLYLNSDSGIYMISGSNYVYNITSYSNGYGLRTESTGGSSTISNSTFYNNSAYGISLGTNTNNIYNNNFTNTNNAYDSGTGNKWNITRTIGTNIINGSYIGGNFWSDYEGCDNNSDGIGEDTYNITATKIDYLPLINTPCPEEEEISLSQTDVFILLIMLIFLSALFLSIYFKLDTDPETLLNNPFKICFFFLCLLFVFVGMIVEGEILLIANLPTLHNLYITIASAMFWSLAVLPVWFFIKGLYELLITLKE